MSPLRFISSSLLVLAASLIPLFNTQAQITNVTNDTATPVEGAGHNYIKLLSETVNPASGSLSLRIQLPIPKSRGITIPFSLAYDSNSVHHLVPGYYPNYGQAYWYSNTGYLAQGGWSYSIPQLSFSQFTIPDNVLTGFTGQQPVYTVYNCYYATNYTFREASGGVHSLYLGAAWRDTSNEPPSCEAPSPAVGGDIEVSGSLTQPAATGPGAMDLPAAVYDNDGTVYTFPTITASTENPITYFSLPSTIEDRNGNVVKLTTSGSGASLSLAVTDTAGRPAVSILGFGPSGTTNSVTTPEGTYQITWTTTTASFSIPTPTWVGPSGFPNEYDECFAIPAVSDTQTVISQIVLPNGQQYHFYYGSNPNPSFNNPYGMLSEIDYPSGGSVRYTWKLSDTQNELADYPGVYDTNYLNCSTDPYQPCPAAAQDGCLYTYQTPVVASRQVSFNGSSTALVQTFQYNTQWNGTAWQYKTTNVTTTDDVINNNFVTVYKYLPITVGNQPFSYTTVPNQIAVENTVQYYNWGNNSSPLRTVTKSWLDQFRMQSQQTTLDNGQNSLINYIWSGDNITEKDEYDYGQSSPSRKTITNYQTFPTTPHYIFDRPCQLITEDGSNNSYAETDYLYDGGTSTCGSAGTPSTTAVSNLPTGTHDETLFAPGSTTSRGNITTVTKKCLQSCTNATTTYAYDETGQVLSATDPCGNSTCGDMSATSHTTSFSYADSYTVLSGGANSGYTPTHNTNAYLTKITNPLGQKSSFTYDYNNGQLTVSTDENLQSTRFLYNDPFSRPTLVNYPDGGQTTLAYNDAPYNPSTPSPSVTTTKAMTTSTNLTTLAAADGLGHVVETLLTSDPDCSTGDRTDTTYDGEGHAHTVSNPYCTTSDPTYGITTYAYDSLGRATQVTHPDSTTVLTTYTGRATQVQDEGNANGTQRVTRISQSDALGRLNSVCEVSTSTLIGQNGASSACGQDIGGQGFLTSYSYDVLDNLTGVTQGTMPSRTFSYDSRSQLISSVNPESNTATTPSVQTVPTTYTYDANGNLATKTGPLQNQTGTATVTTTYTYDALNRLTQKSYSDGTTPGAGFYYDSYTNWNGTNTVGRLVLSTAGSQVGGCIITFNSYDPMGRITLQVQYLPVITNCASNFRLPYTYDLMGNMITANDAYQDDFTYGYNAAARLTSVTGSYHDADDPANLVSGTHYNAAGQITSDALGDGETETFTYTKRNQLQAESSVLNSTSIYSYSLNFAANGDVTAANDSVNGNWNYRYDEFNRLACSNLASNGTCASPTSGTPTYAYVYDRFGNRWQQNGPSGGPYNFSTTFTGNATSNNNRMDLYTYDTAGNLLNNGTHSYFYDAENRLIQVDGTLPYCTSNGASGSAATACYYYDANGRRIHRTGYFNDNCDSTGKRDYVYDLNGHAIVEINDGGTACDAYLFVGDRQFSRLGGGTFFSHADWLGTIRLINSDANPTYGAQVCTSLPFGDGLACNSYSSNVNHFTGKERDFESGLDNFGARYNASSMGRFMSPGATLVNASSSLG